MSSIHPAVVAAGVILISGMGLALVCMMASVFGDAVFPKKWNWDRGFGDRLADAAMGFMSGGVLLALIVGGVILIAHP